MNKCIWRCKRIAATTRGVGAKIVLNWWQDKQAQEQQGSTKGT
jgi:hypothetical protein